MEIKNFISFFKGADCPFIVCMSYAFVTQDRVCFVLDLMNGGDLHYHLTQHGCFTGFFFSLNQKITYTVVKLGKHDHYFA